VVEIELPLAPLNNIKHIIKVGIGKIKRSDDRQRKQNLLN
jgi:hypothetical protein